MNNEIANYPSSESMGAVAQPISGMKVIKEPGQIVLSYQGAVKSLDNHKERLLRLREKLEAVLRPQNEKMGMIEGHPDVPADRAILAMNFDKLSALTSECTGIVEDLLARIEL
jgi:hypothetical protein